MQIGNAREEKRDEISELEVLVIFGLALRVNNNSHIKKVHLGNLQTNCLFRTKTQS